MIIPIISFRRFTMSKKIDDFDYDFTPLGHAIKKAREAKGITREQLAEILP